MPSDSTNPETAWPWLVWFDGMGAGPLILTTEKLMLFGSYAVMWLCFRTDHQKCCLTV